MGDTFIVADVSARRRFDSPKQRRRGGNLQSAGSTLPQRHFKKWGRGESACWSEQGLKIAWDKTETARLLMCARTKRCRNANGNMKKQTKTRAEVHTQHILTCPNGMQSKSAAVSSAEDWLQLIMSPHEMVSLYPTPLLRPSGQSTLSGTADTLQQGRRNIYKTAPLRLTPCITGSLHSTIVTFGKCFIIHYIEAVLLSQCN